MIQRFTIFLLFIFLLVQVQADNNDLTNMSVSELIKQLDQTIEKRSTYEEQKEARISFLKDKLKRTDNRNKRFQLMSELSNEYLYYICDSAIKYIDDNWKIALREGNANRQATVMFTRIQMLLSMGMHSEALEILKLVQPAKLSDNQKRQYYHCCEQTYGDLKNYATHSIYWEEYKLKSSLYQDSLLMITPKNSNPYMRVFARKLKTDGDINSAKEIFNDLLSNYDVGTRDYSMITASLAGMETNVEERKRLLILSSISDVMSAVKEYKSLRELAIMLYNEGDIERAYHYCSICMDDANFYNARHRSLEIAQIQPIINKAYRQKIEKQHAHLRFYFIVISLLCLLLAVSFGALYIQNKKLRTARRELQHVNNELCDVNRKLQRLNDSLSESNKVKEEYLNRFMKLSSQYIASLKQYQASVYSKVVTGKISELKVNLCSTEIVNDAIRKFYQSFDEAFLTIYPNFMVEFNQLLREDARFELSTRMTLPPEMRIFALIRLGISDTESIANLLQYSTNTVYTYATKIRGRALNKEEFNKKILLIG